MARDTQGPVPGATDGMRRVSLTAPHWRGARRMLAAQAVVLAVLAVLTLAVTMVSAPHTRGPQIVGIGVGATLGWTLLGAAVAAGVAVMWRRVALVVTSVLSIAALTLVVTCAVAVVHGAHPFGSTAPVLLVWASLCCYNFAVAMWLVPDQIEGPDWITERTSRSAGQPRQRKGRS